MKTYRILPDKKRTYTLLDGETPLSTLKYDGMFSNNGVMDVPNTLLTIRIENTNFWKGIYEVKEGDRVLLSYRMNWKGIIEIRTFFGYDNSVFSLKSEGYSWRKFSLADITGKELVKMDSEMTWSNYKHIFTTTEEFETMEYKEVFLLSLVHSINYFISTRVAVAT